ncbi:MAG: Ig-like domain-containing protein [Gemmatimonadaceae bacterium]|nr:Ig-like domain-containing protein [Gemmatimonadaceae bacterium]
MERGSSFVRLVTLVSTTILAAACSGSDAGGVSTPPAPPVDRIVVEVSPRIDSIPVGTSRSLSVSVTNGAGVARNVPVTWTSLSPAIATVSNGTVTAIAAGDAQVVVTAGAAADTARLTVYGAQLALQLSPGAVDATLGDTITFEATIVDQAGTATRVQDITWALSDSSAAELIGAGTVATRESGTLAVMATVNSRTATAAVQVRSATVSSITIVPSNLSLAVGTNATLAADLRDSRGRSITGRAITWTSSNASVAVVEKSGAVRAIAVGGAIITATAGGKSATAAVNVYSAGASSVTIALPNDSLGTGRTMQAVAQPLDAEGNLLTGKVVAWQSSNPSVATINSAGVITALASGKTNIAVICDGKTSTVTLTTAVPVATTVTVTPPTATLTVGTTSRLTADVRDQFDFKLSGAPVTWSSAAASIASVATDGTVTAKVTGTTSIRATSGALSATSAVTVQGVPVASVHVSPETLAIEEGDVVQLVATAYDASGNVLDNRPVSWTASSATVTVSATGSVSGVKAGTATVTANIEGKTAKSTVTVSTPQPPEVAKVTLTLNSSALSVGQVTSAVARVYDAEGNLLAVPVTYVSSAPSIATVDVDGTVSAVSAGSAAITATADGVSGLASVAVSAPQAAPVATVALTAPSTTLFVGDSTTLSVTLLDAAQNVLTGRTIAYASSNAQVATVSASGLVRGVGAGSANISATSGSASKSLTFTIRTVPTVPPTVAVVTVTLAQSALVVGGATQATAVLTDSSGAPFSGTVAWSSSNTAVATVSQSGYVSVVGVGSAVISASSGGKTGSATLSATAPAATVKTVTVTLASPSIVVGTSAQVTAVARDSAGNVLTGKSVSWSSSATSVASLAASNTGTNTATAVAAGTSKLSATVGGVSGNATLTVTAPPANTPPASTPVTLPALPTILNPVYPKVTGKQWAVHAGDNLQSILNQAQRGDEIVIDAGATFTGNFTLPVKTGSTAANGWIIVRSSQQSALPPQGTRVTSQQASLMPKIFSPNTMTALTAGVNTGGWWISGVEFSLAPTVTSAAGSIVAIGLATSAQNSLSLVPSDFVLDRVYIHAQPNQSIQRCLELHAARVAVMDSYLVECHGKGFDSQAIVGWNGTGPYKIVNNTLAGAGENVMFGGADPKVPGAISSDIEIRRNYIYTPASWKGVWTKKNIFETKASQRVLIEGNVFEGSWTDAQTGYAFVLKVANQSGGCTWCISNDITIRNNIVRNAGAGVGITGKDGSNTIGGLLSRLLIENNYFENINTGAYTGAGRMIAIMNDAHDVTIRSNTMTAPGALSHYLNIATQSAATNFAFQNNVMTLGTYGLFSSWYGSGETPNLAAFRGTVVFQKSVLIGAAQKNYPNAQFVSSLSAAQSTGIGADMAAINAATQGVVIP